MRIGLNSFLYASPFTTESTKLFAKFKKWGFDTVEIPVEDPSHIDPVKVRAAAAKAGIAIGSICACMGPGRDFRGSDEDEICIEPLNRFETDFLNTSDQGLRLVKAVGSKAVKLHLDTFHMNIEEKNQAAAIRKVGKLLGHFHACGSDRGTPGGDHIAWPEIVKALKAIGYKGDVVIESFTTDVKVIARAAAIWRKIEPKRDDIAVNGLKFLRKVLK
jgi:sugar phosphate isomerase/epimerase